MTKVHKDNLEVVKKYPHIVVYSFHVGGLCPNCLSELDINVFGNFDCIKCWTDWLVWDKRHRDGWEMEDD